MPTPEDASSLMPGTFLETPPQSTTNLPTTMSNSTERPPSREGSVPSGNTLEDAISNAETRLTENKSYQAIATLEMEGIEPDQSRLKRFLKKFRPDPEEEQNAERLEVLKEHREVLKKEHAALQAELDDLVKQLPPAPVQAPRQT
jgi:chromosome segregation ATPase